MNELETTTPTVKKLRPRKGRRIQIVDGKEIIFSAPKEEAVAAVDAFTFVKGVPKTLRQWMLEFGYDHWVLSRHIRMNTKIVGKADIKTPGKKPDLYQFE